MELLVCLKAVHDTRNSVQFNSTRELAEESVKRYIFNPQDMFAFEEALRFKDQLESCRLTVVSYGGSDAEEILRYAFACGADRAARIPSGKEKVSDAESTAIALAEAVKQLKADLVFCGCRSIGYGRGLVPAMLSHLLDFIYLSGVRNVDFQEDKEALLLEQKVERRTLKLKVFPPAVLGVRQSHQLRYPTALERLRYQGVTIPTLKPDKTVRSKEKQEGEASLDKIVAPKPMKKSAAPAAKTAAGKLGALLSRQPVQAKPGGDEKIFEGKPEQTAKQVLDFIIENRIVSFD